MATPHRVVPFGASRWGVLVVTGSNESSALTPRILCLHCRCLDHWGGWEDALGLFEAIEVAMRVTEAAPNEKVSLLQKIAAVSVPLNKTDDGSPPSSLSAAGCRARLCPGPSNRRQVATTGTQRTTKGDFMQTIVADLVTAAAPLTTNGREAHEWARGERRVQRYGAYRRRW